MKRDYFRLADHSSADKGDDFVGEVVEFSKVFGE